MSYVYVMQSGPYYKIGFTAKDPAKRLTEIQVANPQPVFLVGAIQGTMRDERRLHEVYAAKRTHREWFALSHDDVGKILSGSPKAPDEKEAAGVVFRKWADNAEPATLRFERLPPSAPDLRTTGPLGPEPAGATPLTEEDLQGLIPGFVATRADLNHVEYENIGKAIPWAMRQARRGPEAVLSYTFMRTLHRRMFGDVWRWAGTHRRRETSIGVPPHMVAAESQMRLDDALFWHAGAVFPPDELAARIHGRLVSVHPFPNGNGRCTRLMADLYLTAIGARSFTWGSANLDTDGSGRAAYIAAIVKAATTDDYADLIRFARG